MSELKMHGCECKKNVSTPHNEGKLGDFAKTVLMPGDPLRAKFIAETFLDDVVKVNGVRGMLGYTGKYKGKEISVMGSGMGIPSIAIYSYELFSFYGVETIIRVGSCGGYSDKVKVRDVVLAQGASTNSSFQDQYNVRGHFAPIADFELLYNAFNKAKEMGIDAKVGNMLSSDVFYDDDQDMYKNWAKLGVLGVEMEAAALYMNAARLGKKALCIATVSDHFISKEATTAKEREETFTDMMKIALEIG